MIQQLIYLLCIISQTKSAWPTGEKIKWFLQYSIIFPLPCNFLMHFNPNNSTTDTSDHRIMILLVNKNNILVAYCIMSLSIKPL